MTNMSEKAMSDLQFQSVAYSDDSGREYQGVHVAWEDIAELLGRDHEGSPSDDDRVAAALLESGAPEWVRGAAGWVDEDGLGLIGPLAGGSRDE